MFGAEELRELHARAASARVQHADGAFAAGIDARLIREQPDALAAEAAEALGFEHVDAEPDFRRVPAGGLRRGFERVPAQRERESREERGLQKFPTKQGGDDF